MITHSYKIYKKICLIVSESPDGFEIQTGELMDPQAFMKGQTLLISGKNPNLLWDLLHELVGIPYPLLNSEIKKPEESTPKKELPIKEISPLEQEFKKMSAKEIVKKVTAEKGVTLTCSLKSKKTIIKKALEIYA
jgi:hypothetical protein